MADILNNFPAAAGAMHMEINSLKLKTKPNLEYKEVDEFPDFQICKVIKLNIYQLIKRTE